ncbi:MAG: HEAT repeat domain-containing protein [Anaerovoracaceae bacterium]
MMKRKYETFKYRKLESIEAHKESLSLEDVSILVSFARSKNELIRSWAAELLVNRYTEQSEEILYHMTYDRCDIVRINAVDSLCIGKQLKSLQRLESLFEDDDYLIRGYAVLSHFDVTVNIYGENYNVDNRYIDLMESLLASDTSAWVKVCIFNNLYLCGCEPGIDKIADILDKAVRDGDFEVVWCVLHTLDELVDGDNEVFIHSMINKVYGLLLDAQQDYVKENFAISHEDENKL